MNKNWKSKIIIITILLTIPLSLSIIAKDEKTPAEKKDPSIVSDIDTAGARGVNNTSSLNDEDMTDAVDKKLNLNEDIDLNELIEIDVSK